MKSIAIEGQLRTDISKKSVKAIRRNGGVPCVMYGGKENVHFETNVKGLKSLLYTPDFHTVDINIEGTTYPAVIKDLQFHPVKDSLLHIDFMELVDDKYITTEVPVRLKGLAVGVKEGGKLLMKMRNLKVRALPKDLVDEIIVDVTHLEVGKSARVSQINLPGVEILHSPAIPIASVEITRALRSAAAKEQADSKKKK